MASNIPQGEHTLGYFLKEIIENQTGVTPQEEVEFIKKNMPDQDFTEEEAAFLKPYWVEGKIKIRPKVQRRISTKSFLLCCFLLMIVLAIVAVWENVKFFLSL